MRMKSIHALSIIAFAVILVSVLWLPTPGKVGELLAGSSLQWLAIVLLLYFANLFVKGYRWYLLLDSSEEMSFRGTLPYYTVSLSINNLVPGRVAGEPFRIMYVKTADGYPITKGMATIVWEKGLDMIVVVLMAILGTLMVANILPYNIGITLMGLSIAMLVATIILLYLLVKRRLSAIMIPIIVRVGRMTRISFLAEKVPDQVRTFEASFETLASRRLIGPTVAMTVVIWLNEAARFFLIYVLVLPDNTWIHPGAVLVAVTVATLLSIVLPAGGGSLLGLNTVLLALALPTERVAAASLLSVATSVWLSFLIGAAVMVFIIYRHRGD